MKLLRLLLTGGGLGGLALLTGGCLKAPDYSTTPEISFNKVAHYSFNNAAGQGDSIAVTLNYQDGDGDLGLTADEVKKDSVFYRRPFNNNYFVEPYIKVPSTGQYVRLADSGRGIPAGAYNGRFQHVSSSSDGHALPLKGTLTWGFSFVRYYPFQPGETIRFQIYIADRAKHVSNTITTDDVPLDK